MDDATHPAASIEPSFQQLFAASLAESLSHMLGEKAAAATIKVMRLKEIEEQPEQTLLKLRKLFGSGSQVIERIAMKEFFIKLGVPWNEDKSSDVSAMLDAARESYVKFYSSKS